MVAAQPTAGMLVSWSVRRLVRALPALLLITAALWVTYKFMQVVTVRHPESVGGHPPTTGRQLVTLPVPSGPPPPQRWVVAQTRQDDCATLAAVFHDWNILLLGVTKKPGYSHSRCLYYSAAMAAQDAQNLSASLPPTALAYLHIIQVRGADVIYVLHPNVDPLGVPAQPTESMLMGQYHGVIVKTTHGHFNPQVHWGCNITDTASQGYIYQLCGHMTPVIQSEADLGIQSRFKLNRGAEEDVQAESLGCDYTAPSVTLSHGTFAPIQFHGTVYHRGAFWALPVQPLGGGKQEEAWGYLVQKLLWTRGDRVAVFVPSRKHAVSLTTGSKPGIPLTAHLPHLASIHCNQSASLPGCLDLMLSQLAQWRLLLGSSFVEVFKQWLAALDGDTSNDGVSRARVPQDVCRNESLHFHPVRHDSPVITDRYQRALHPIPNLEQHLGLHNRTCSDFEMRKVTNLRDPNYLPRVDLSRPWVQFTDVLLIVIFNKPHYEALPYVEVLYRGVFPHILYCGPGIPDSRSFPMLRAYNVSFVSYGSTPDGHFPGSFNYECMIMAANMRYNVRGYLAIADDITLFIHQVASLYKDHLHQVWFLPKDKVRVGDLRTLRECRLGMCDYQTVWHWWEDYRTQSTDLLDRFKRDQKQIPLIRKCYREILRITGAEYRLFGGYSDIFYLPARLVDDFASLARMFLSYGVFLEIAVPTILQCIESREDIQPLFGFDNWSFERDQPWSFFSKQTVFRNMFMHPTKWGYLRQTTNTTKEFTDFYCHMVSFVQDRFERIIKINHTNLGG